MRKAMTAAAALVLGVALAAAAQANGTMHRSAMPSKQTVQSGSTVAPQASKQRTKLSKRMTARRHISAKRTGKQTLASLNRRKTSTKTSTRMARLHRRSLQSQQPSTAVGSSAMPNNTNTNLNSTPSLSDQTTAGSGSSTMPQGQNNLNQTLPNPNTPNTTR